LDASEAEKRNRRLYEAYARTQYTPPPLSTHRMSHGDAQAFYRREHDPKTGALLPVDRFTRERYMFAHVLLSALCHARCAFRLDIRWVACAGSVLHDWVQSFISQGERRGVRVVPVPVHYTSPYGSFELRPAVRRHVPTAGRKFALMHLLMTPELPDAEATATTSDETLAAETGAAALTTPRRTAPGTEHDPSTTATAGAPPAMSGPPPPLTSPAASAAVTSSGTPSVTSAKRTVVAPKLPLFHGGGGGYLPEAPVVNGAARLVHRSGLCLVSTTSDDVVEWRENPLLRTATPQHVRLLQKFVALTDEVAPVLGDVFDGVFAHVDQSHLTSVSSAATMS
jgi:hypothetical protein